MRDDAKHLDHVPGDDGLPIIGRTVDLLRDAWALDDEMYERFGEVFRCHILGRRNVNLRSPALATKLLLDRERNFSSKYGWGHVLGQLFPGGLMLRDFDDHQRNRKIMQAAFRGPARAAYHERLERDFAERLDGWGHAPSMKFYPAIKRTLLEQAGAVLLGLAAGAKLAPQLGNFVDLIRASMAVVRRELPGTTWRRGMVARRELAAYLRDELPKRRAGQGHDVFSILCRAQDEDGERLDDEAIVDHMIFMLFAAHDTTASGLTTLLDELTLAPALQERAARECLALREQLDGAPLPFEALGELAFVDRCFREALRVSPPVPYIVRRTVEACPVAGYELPRHTPLVLHVRGPHLDAELWTEPDRFDPDRFEPERAEERSHPHAWIPFGGGAHRCIGAEFARQQAKVFVYHLLTRYRVERVHAQRGAWKGVPLPAPRDGLPVRLSPRR